MIRYICDGCGFEHEHGGPELPPEWAAIVARVDWEAGEGEQQEQECNARLLCSQCRGTYQDSLCRLAERVLSHGLDQRPQPSRSLTYSQACDLLARYAVALQDRQNCGDEMQPEYMAALKACTDAMGATPQ